MTATQPVINRGIVKQVLSGDAVIIRGQPKGGPPPERQLNLSNITAPKLARRANPTLENSSETKDEAYAWEAREFLRKKLVGKEVCFTVEYTTPIGREYGCIYLGKDLNGENITASLVAEGLVDVRRGGIKPTNEQQQLCDLEDIAKAANKGKHDASSHPQHIRNVKWSIENPRHFLDLNHGQSISAIVEYARDGCTVRVSLLPSFHTITLMISGIKCPTFKLEGDQNVEEPYAAEAKFFTESRLLQRDVEVILESVSNQNFVGSIVHPKGNIAELLLKEGFAKCVDWNMAGVTHGAEVLRAAEKYAKERRLRVWKDYEPKGPAVDAKDKQFQAKVVEVSNADALVVQGPNGVCRKIFLASIRPPRLPDQLDNANSVSGKDKGSRQFRPLYDIPYMFEAREFLRKKLIGKKVTVTVDYIQPKSDAFPEKVCCTVTIGGINVAEALVSKGLATVVRYRADNDQRSAHYDELLAAESKAIKNAQGLHSKKETPIHRVADVSGDSAKAKQFLPFLQRAGRSEAIVEYIMSGSRLRLYVPRETCLITFLLGGITCPRASRRLPGNALVEGEPLGEEALQFTKDKCLQKEVEIEVDTMDKAGSFIGWLYVDGLNLSVGLVEEGLATVHFSAERSVHAKVLQQAEENAKKKKINIWVNFEEIKVEKDIAEEPQERKINQKSVVVTEVTKDFHFYAQYADKVAKLEEMMKLLKQELTNNPPLPGSYIPQRGNMCAAKFVDGEWYRAKAEKVVNKEIHIFYVDYGNREVTDTSKIVPLPSICQGLPSLCQEFALACVKIPEDPEFKLDALEQFKNDTLNKEMLLNVEYRLQNLDYVTLLYSDSKEDVAKNLITDGLLLVEQRKEKRLQKLVNEYAKAQEAAKAERVNLWRYGDFTEDDADEFGFR